MGADMLLSVIWTTTGTVDVPRAQAAVREALARETSPERIEQIVTGVVSAGPVCEGGVSEPRGRPCFARMFVLFVSARVSEHVERSGYSGTVGRGQCVQATGEPHAVRADSPPECQSR
jgi:hypothetical protein